MAVFNEKEFIVTNIVNGIKKGTFAKEYGNIMAVKFVAKGFITFEEVAIIDAEITAWEEAQKIEPPVEEPIEDVTTEETEIEDEMILDETEGTETEVEGTEEPTEIIEDSTIEEELPETEPTEPTE